MPKSEQQEVFPSITPDTIKDREALLKFIPLSEMVAKREMRNMPAYAADFRELVNIGLIKINSLIREASERRQTYNPSYIAQAIVWDIKNKNRKEAHQRGEYRGSSNREDSSGDSFSLAEIREAVIDTVVSFDEVAYEISDEGKLDPAEQLELSEMKQAIRNAIALLPDNYRTVIELRFYRGLKGTEIADRLGVSSARVTRIIQDAIGLMRDKLNEKRML